VSADNRAKAFSTSRLLVAVTLDIAQNQFERVRSYPKISAERAIKDEDREEYEGDASR